MMMKSFSCFSLDLKWLSFRIVTHHITRKILGVRRINNHTFTFLNLRHLLSISNSIFWSCVIRSSRSFSTRNLGRCFHVFVESIKFDHFILIFIDKSSMLLLIFIFKSHLLSLSCRITRTLNFDNFLSFWNTNRPKSLTLIRVFLEVAFMNFRSGDVRMGSR